MLLLLLSDWLAPAHRLSLSLSVTLYHLCSIVLPVSLDDAVVASRAERQANKNLI